MAARSKGSKGSPGSRPGEAPRPESVTLKVTLDRETARLLRLEAFGRDVSLGKVVEELMKSSPRRFVLVDRGKGSVGAETPRAVEAPRAQEPRQGPPTLGVVSEAG